MSAEFELLAQKQNKRKDKDAATSDAHRTAPPKAKPSAVRGALPANTPCFCLYRWAHSHDGAETDVTLLLFCRPEEAPLRAKMLHASSLRPLLGRLRGEYAIEIRKSIEGLEPDEVNEEQLQRELYVYE